MSNETNKNKQATTSVLKGEVSYEEQVIKKIVGHALKTIEGLLSVDGGFFSNLKEKLVNSESVTDGVNVEVGKKQVAVDLNIIVEYDKDIPKIADEMKAVIAKNVEKMTHLEVVEVNINVVDIQTKEEFEKNKVSLQDRLSNVAQSTGELASDTANKAKDAVVDGTENVKENLAKSRVE
ncbi:Asp23/Gls24 family envelope stress response protein [Streptococcus marimammalium]|uniref:Asp23/Gls24 family envelope stress response protein n=1 Tax=Streptococcus marimammalium TaxID=269666 RepID=UPI0003666548|nr:Asp23/Gls24 family envelope stress response protein [Streptococcus marimammalium]